MVIFKCSSSGNNFQFHSQKMLFFLWVVWSSLCVCSLFCMLGWMLLDGRKAPSKAPGRQEAIINASYFQVLPFLLQVFMKLFCFSLPVLAFCFPSSCSISLYNFSDLCCFLSSLLPPHCGGPLYILLYTDPTPLNLLLLLFLWLICSV